MAFTGVTNAHGPSPQPTACRSPTCSLTTSTGSNQAQGKILSSKCLLPNAIDSVCNSLKLIGVDELRFMKLCLDWNVPGALKWEEMKSRNGPSGKLLRLWNCKIIETILEGQCPTLFDNWADTCVLLKTSMVNAAKIFKSYIESKGSRGVKGTTYAGFESLRMNDGKDRP